MAQTTIGFGAALIILGVIGYGAAPTPSVTALIPSIFGIILAALGFAARNPRWSRHAMHGAVVIGLLGALAPLQRLIPAFTSGTFTWSIATGSLLVMLIICGIFTGLCVRSFIQARRNVSA